MGEHRTSSGNGYGRTNQFILVVDEDDHDLSCICLLLNRFHYQILKATTDKQALATATGLVPCLVVVSLDLPGMTGFKLIRQLKSNPSTSHIPVLGLLRQDSRDLKDRCLEHGAADCLCHPIEAEALYRSVQKALEKNPRSGMRVRIVLPVKVYGKQCETLYGAYTLALSAGGIFLRTMNPVTVNTEISLEFDLNGTTIAADTMVLYNCQARGPCEESGIGLRFVDIASKDQDMIRQFIRNEVMKGIPHPGMQSGQA